VPVVAVVIVLLLNWSAARADIYRYVDENGVECFTDAPRSSAAKVYRTTPEVGRRSGADSQPRAPRRNTPAAVEADPGEEKYVLPLAGSFTSLVGMRIDPFDGVLRHHDGVDIAAPAGSEVHAAAPGVVIFSGPRQGYGNTVIIEHGDGTQTLYAHNARNLCRQGERVGGATVIALCGSTGRSTGPHLHFEAWRDGVNITPNFVDAWQGMTAASLPSPLPVPDRIRRLVQPDGSLFFTNLP
jgi:murein DD-endopeptidase MepM/ murein hydrolase activator NlpD